MEKKPEVSQVYRMGIDPYDSTFITMNPVRTKLQRIINFIKQEWPAIIASVLFGALMTVAVELVVRNWEYIKGTF